VAAVPASRPLPARLRPQPTREPTIFGSGATPAATGLEPIKMPWGGPDGRGDYLITY
jgi:hypothetical protein